MGAAVWNRTIREGVTETTPESRLGGGVSHVDLWWMSIPGPQSRKQRATHVGEGLACFRKSKKASTRAAPPPRGRGGGDGSENSDRALRRDRARSDRCLKGSLRPTCAEQRIRLEASGPVHTEECGGFVQDGCLHSTGSDLRAGTKSHICLQPQLLAHNNT